ncbi:hypothetical protein N7533_010878 [Penicillium manginii]|jgi:acetylornithine deacetylase/succinyl-diaminopimelate desuccinylase-like protein|uniref:uncharacterized protein n=1 Tax=Penicillium manginii TaxID=203109 RepID=UPI00254679A0|nr:uncharacterized protein N7533_010878 [Penicillium manginii]KAJ5741469.1 hypothetical protein N7533_010878 [Penicillium manginii]
MASQIIAVEELRKQGLIEPDDVSLLSVVGEEKGGTGKFTANGLRLSWEAVVFAEPTDNLLAIGLKAISSSISSVREYPPIPDIPTTVEVRSLR